MSLEVMAFIGFILGIVLAVTGVLLAFNTDQPGWLVSFFLGIVLTFGSIIVGSIESDKRHCLNDIPVISQTETKWLNGECYVKANDGRFVPQEWIEEGYNK